MQVIGVAGTAKNTGKTTTLTSVLAEAVQSGIRTAVTSIGYDGESFDHLTGLPKPRITLEPGTLAATAKATLAAATAELELVGTTGVATALGEVVLVRVLRRGLVPLAGPPTGAGLRIALVGLGRLGAELVLVDGAFGRIAPMSGLDGLILATGAARSRDLQVLVEETAALSWMFNLPQLAVPPDAVPHRNLLSADAAIHLAEKITTKSSLVMDGAVTDKALAALADCGQWRSAARLIFSDPIQLALGGPPVKVREALKRLAATCELGIRRQLPLLAWTVNPFYPQVQDGGAFKAGYLKSEDLRRKLTKVVQASLVDIVQDGGARIMERLEIHTNVLTFQERS